jgi:hypothetical protein
MRTSSAVWIVAVAAAALLAGCSGGSQGTGWTIPGSDLARTGIAPNSGPFLRIGAVPARHHHRYLGLKDLYVADITNNAIEILANGPTRTSAPFRTGSLSP